MDPHTHDADRALAAFLDDLEQEAAGALAGERELEVAERARAEYARVDLAARLMGGLGHRVGFSLAGVGRLSGEIVRVADGWLLLEEAGAAWVVLLGAVETVRGLPARALPSEAWPLTARLGLGSALRGMAGERAHLRLRSGAQLDGQVTRIGADFVEVTHDGGTSVAVSFSALSAVRR